MKRRPLPEPLASLANRAGSIKALRELMLNLPPSTFGRWKLALEKNKLLPRNAVLLIEIAKNALPAEEKDNPKCKTNFLW